jgi:replicative DNA helicase
MTAPDRPGHAAEPPLRNLTGGATHLAERALLGEVLKRPERLADLDGWITAGIFADPQYAAIYDTVSGLHARGELLSATSHPDAVRHNVITTLAALRAGPFSAMPQISLRSLSDLPASAPDTADNAAGTHVIYGRILLSSATRRTMHAYGIRLAQATTATNEVHDNRTADLSDAHHAFLEQLAELGRAHAQVPTTGGAGLPHTPLHVTTPPNPRLVERAERAILAAVLHDPTGQHTELRDRLQPEDFTARHEHSNTWRAVQTVAARGEPINLVTVAWQLEHLPPEHQPALSHDELTNVVALAIDPLPTTDRTESTRSTDNTRTMAPSEAIERQVATIARASLYHRVRSASKELMGAARNTSHTISALIENARRVATDLHQHAARLTEPAAQRSTGVVGGIACRLNPDPASSHHPRGVHR